jgi:hypothetical protein
MNDEQIVDIWNLFKNYIDKKHVETIAEKFIDLLADYGIDDISFKDCLGHDKDLDAAILYYLDLDADVDDYDEYEDE